MIYKEECAEALGFSSVEEMDNHQLWLDEQKTLDEKIKERVINSVGGVIDIRDLFKGN